MTEDFFTEDVVFPSESDLNVSMVFVSWFKADSLTLFLLKAVVVVNVFSPSF